MRNKYIEPALYAKWEIDAFGKRTKKIRQIYEC